jgi:Putative peptidoglycan binding domain
MSLDSTSAHEQLGSAAGVAPQHVEVDLAVVPTLAAVRVGGHATFDRVVFELEGDRPGHDVRYVDQVVQDGSGLPIPLDGRAFLQVSLIPATALSEEGPFGPLPSVAGLAALRGLAFAGDFEAVVTFGIGVAGRTAFRVLQLDAPSRVAIDVTHTPPGTGTQLLRRGDRGAAVATWQWRLRLAGQAVDVDEDFGPATEAATRDFQHANGLAADGIVGPLSRRAMERSLGL